MRSRSKSRRKAQRIPSFPIIDAPKIVKIGPFREAKRNKTASRGLANCTHLLYAAASQNTFRWCALTVHRSAKIVRPCCTPSPHPKPYFSVIPRRIIGCLQSRPQISVEWPSWDFGKTQSFMGLCFSAFPDQRLGSTVMGFPTNCNCHGIIVFHRLILGLFRAE